MKCFCVSGLLPTNELVFRKAEKSLGWDLFKVKLEFLQIGNWYRRVFCCQEKNNFFESHTQKSDKNQSVIKNVQFWSSVECVIIRPKASKPAYFVFTFCCIFNVNSTKIEFRSLFYDVNEVDK